MTSPVTSPAGAARGVATAVGAGLAGAGLVLTVANLGRVRDVRGTVHLAPGRWPPERVAVLLPVRDEAAQVAACVTRLSAAAARWPGPTRVVVLDDGSSDGTGAVLADLVDDGRLADPVEVVTGAPLPPGWLGKPWACAQLAAAVPDADVLVFVDADVELAEEAVAASVGLLRSTGLDLVCPYPHQVAHGPAERLVQPLLAWSWMSLLPLGAAERSRRASLTAANGQLLVVDAAAYARAGGHGAVRGEVLEDIALLRAVKRSGGRGVVAEGSTIASCRMYDGWPALRAGYAKSLWSAFGSPARAALVAAALLTTYVVPAAAALRGSRVGLAGYLAGVASRALVARRTGSRVRDAWAHPLSVLLVVGLTADSVAGRRRGRLSWKGRPVEVAAVGER